MPENADIPILLPLDEDLDENDYKNIWFYGCGFVVGLGGVYCTLWRNAYFQFLKLS